MFGPVIESIRASRRPDAAKTTIDLSRLPARDISYLSTMDALIEAAGNSLEAFATAPLWYDIIDIGFVRDVLWYRNELRPYIEYQMKMGKV